MAAIITKHQRIQNARNFISDFSDSPVQNYLYLWIGKSDPWNDDIESQIDGTIDIPIDGEYQISKIYNEMIGMKRIFENNMTHAVPTFAWTSGEIYQAWDDEYSEIVSENGCSISKTIYDTQFYVITTNFNIYKCLVSGAGVSTQMPTHTDNISIEPKMYADGYVWHYMDTITTNDALVFYNNAFCPIREKTEQHADQNNIEGGIFRIIVENGGTGYTAATTITIEGNGSGAIAEATINAGVITSIDITTTVDDYLNHGTGYDYAKVIITDSGGGTGASARAVLSPRGGHGFDPIAELGAYNIEIAIDIEGDEEGKFITTNDYRRIGLIKNPYETGSPVSVLASSIALGCLRSLELSSVSGTFSADEVIEEAATGGDGSNKAKAFIDQFDTGTPNKIYFHQNEKTGWDPFTVGVSISSTESNSATITAINDSDYEPFTGEILFMENRSPIQRTQSTREEIRLIVQF